MRLEIEVQKLGNGREGNNAPKQEERRADQFSFLAGKSFHLLRGALCEKNDGKAK